MERLKRCRPMRYLRSVLMSRATRLINIGPRLMFAKLGQGSRRRALLPMLLSIDDLPLANWKMLNDIALRPGVVGLSHESDARARKIGSTLAVRTFVDLGESLWLTIKVFPMATMDDAVLWTSRLKDRSVNDRTSPSHTSHEFVDEIVGVSDLGVSKGLRFEFTDEFAGSSHFFVKKTAGFVGSVAFEIRLMAREDTLSWDEIVAIATIQGERIKEVLNY